MTHFQAICAESAQRIGQMEQRFKSWPMFRHSFLLPTMKVYLPLLLSASSFLTTTMARTFSVTNNCPYTIWPALLTYSGTAPNHPAGWLASPSSGVSFTVPDDWVGQIWGRRDCNFTSNSGPDSCLDGGCPGGLICTRLGQSPVTVAEFSLGPIINSDAADQYDISLINGFNLPMRIKNDAHCAVSECSVDLGAKCPTPLQEPFQPPGFPSGCNSACTAGLAHDPNNDPNCCTGKYNDPQICVPSGVQYYSYFKSNCPDTFVYAFDQSNEKAGSTDPLFTCPSGSQANYAITFCSKKD
ncbi:Osmotin thaumatin-like protein [Lactarius quietus]|nr:Osmotin thaumatin-like protein [Lactarius quietus]